MLFLEDSYLKEFDSNIISTNLNQIIVNGVQYNDSIVGKNMHTIRTEKVMKVENKYRNKIPERFVKEYGHITF